MNAIRSAKECFLPHALTWAAITTGLYFMVMVDFVRILISLPAGRIL